MRIAEIRLEVHVPEDITYQQVLEILSKLDSATSMAASGTRNYLGDPARVAYNYSEMRVI